MSKEDSAPGGLLSKVVRFVRNPTVNWNDLDSIETERESQYSKQVLKEMIERKRRNDFVRRREFDHLRKLRQRNPVASQCAEEPDEQRPSFFQSSLTSPVERAVTIKKIDEIEAQMSMQWWKNKPHSSGIGTHSAYSAAAPLRASPVATNFAATAPLSLPAPTAPAPLANLSADAVTDAPIGALVAPLVPARPLFVDNHLAMMEFGLAPNKPSTQPDNISLDTHRLGTGNLPAAEMEEFVHEPDLEEAAIRFANGDHAGAETCLLGVLAQHAKNPPEQQWDIWMTLFDLYRATDQQDRFDTLALDFAARFSRSAPLWFSIPEQLGLVSAAPIEADLPGVRRNFIWNAPTTLTAQSVASLRASLERAAPPWTLVWSRLTAMEDTAVVALEKELSRWAEQKVQLIFIGAEKLDALLQARTQSGNGAGNPAWWALRMATLRCMNRADEFEMVALDYCVTYEVSPPSWLAPRCSYSDVPLESDAAGAAAAPAQDLLAKPNWGAATEPAPLSVLNHIGQGGQGGQEQGQGQPLPTLTGHIENDATALLDALASNARPGQPLVIPCDRLIRIDFSAAGSVLNWAADQQNKGRDVRFENLHRLVAVFFNVIGISEHARVVPRKN
ncbi:MAG: STAS domain-containing protein [Burkholderiaceae bacterium]|nr:STAS domain-containing protein [Burkholderiaceae bacterium]